MTRKATHGASVTGPRKGRGPGGQWKAGSSPATPEANALVASTIAAHPWLDKPEFLDSVRAWAFAYVRINRVQEYLDSVGMLDGHGRPRPATKLLLTLEASAARARAALGFDPASFAAIRKTVIEADGAAAALDAGAARGREVFSQRAAAIEATPPPADDSTEGVQP